MAENTVEYILRLQDQISGTLKNIEKNTNAMNASMKHSTGLVHELKGAFAEIFAITEVIGFLKESFKAFQDDAMAAANLNVGIRNLHGTLGISTEALKQQREELSKHSLASQTTIEKAQAMLTTFQSVHGDIFKRAIPAISDLAQKMNIDLVDATKSVGFALDNPTEGMMRLRRQGIMFTDAQKVMITTLDQTGKHAQAQATMLKILEARFHGAGQAAADANPWKVFQNQVEETMIKVGANIGKIGVNFMPILNKLLSAVQPIVDALSSIFQVVLPPIIALLEPIMDIFKVIWKTVMAIIQPILTALKPALDAIKPVVDFIGKIFVKIAPVIVFLGKIFGEILGIMIKIEAWLINVEVKFANWVVHTKVFKAIWDSIMWVIEKVMKGISWMVDKIKSLIGMSSDVTVTSATEEVGKGESPDTTAAGAPNSPAEIMASKPKEQKNTVINISIQDLVREFKIVTSNLQMSEGEMKEFIVKTLLSSVNQFNLVPGQ